MLQEGFLGFGEVWQSPPVFPGEVIREQPLQVIAGLAARHADLKRNMVHGAQPAGGPLMFDVPDGAPAHGGVLCHACRAGFQGMCGTNPTRWQSQPEFEVPDGFARHGGQAFLNEPAGAEWHVKAQEGVPHGQFGSVRQVACGPLHKCAEVGREVVPEAGGPGAEQLDAGVPGEVIAAEPVVARTPAVKRFLGPQRRQERELGPQKIFRFREHVAILRRWHRFGVCV